MSRKRQPKIAEGSDWTFEELDRADAEIGRRCLLGDPGIQRNPNSTFS